MLRVKVYNKEGKDVKTLDLPKSIFGVEPNEQVVHQALVAQTANARQVIAHAKARAEVRGGGRKPWRQKGTGRARHGSTRSPLWTGGGVTFGPTKERNFSKRINKKIRRKAIFMVLSDRLSTGDIKFIDHVQMEAIKTKKVAELLKKLDLQKSVLVVIPKSDQIIVKSFRNIPKVTVICADSLNVYDLLKFNKLLIAEKSVETMVQTYLEKKDKPEEKKTAVKKNDKKKESKSKPAKASVTKKEEKAIKK